MGVQSVGSVQILTVWVQTPAQPLLSCSILDKCHLRSLLPHLYRHPGLLFLLNEWVRTAGESSCSSLGLQAGVCAANASVKLPSHPVPRLELRGQVRLYSLEPT